MQITTEKQARKPVSQFLPTGTALKVSEDLNMSVQGVRAILRGEWYSEQVIDAAIVYAEESLRQLEAYRDTMQRLRQN
jgi:hypothetical protein